MVVGKDLVGAKVALVGAGFVTPGGSCWFCACGIPTCYEGPLLPLPASA